VHRGLIDDVHRVAGGETNLARATEALYLRVRMRGWVSAEYGTSSLQRHVLAPFFHPAYIAWARACRPHHKQGATTFAEMLTKLDPDLAGIPVNGGLTGFELARTDAAMRARRSGRGLRRTARKVKQRVGRREKAPASATDLAPGVVRAWGATPDALAPFARLDVFDQRVIEEFSSGSRTSTSGTVALLVNVLSAVEFASAVPDA
jgi:asparagine synthase (glutamine-hydrolysing)